MWFASNNQNAVQSCRRRSGVVCLGGAAVPARTGAGADAAAGSVVTLAVAVPWPSIWAFPVSSPSLIDVELPAKETSGTRWSPGGEARAGGTFGTGERERCATDKIEPSICRV